MVIFWIIYTVGCIASIVFSIRTQIKEESVLTLGNLLIFIMMSASSWAFFLIMLIYHADHIIIWKK